MERGPTAATQLGSKWTFCCASLHSTLGFCDSGDSSSARCFSSAPAGAQPSAGDGSRVRMRHPEHLLPCRCLLPSVALSARCSSSWLACRGAQAAAEPLSGTPADKGQPKADPEHERLTALDVGLVSSDVGVKGQVCSERSFSSTSDWDPWNSPADSASTDPYEDLVAPPNIRAQRHCSCAGGSGRDLCWKRVHPAKVQPKLSCSRRQPLGGQVCLS